MPKGIQRLLLGQWQDDQYDQYHPETGEFFTQIRWALANDVLREVFLESLFVMDRDYRAPIQRIIRRFHGQRVDIQWKDVENSRYTRERMSWRQIAAHLQWTDEWDQYELTSHLILLKEEFHYPDCCRNELSDWERDF